MKKISIYIASAMLCCATLFSSCEEMFGDFLDKQPSNELTEDEVFHSWKNTQAYHYDIFNFLRSGLGRIQNSWMDAASDLAHTSYATGGVRSSLNIGNYYASGGASELNDTWYHYYRAIRKCNTLLERIDQVPLSSEETAESRLAMANRMKSEARFFRAYFYWELCLRYGGVPLVTERLDPEQSHTNLPRASETDCFEFILTELNECLEYLPNDLEVKSNPSDLGRITRGIDLALLSRIKLYLASPRYSSLGLAQWQDAADAYLLFKQETGSIYSLFHSAVASDNHYALAITQSVPEGNNTEVIFWRNEGKKDWWKNESPVGFGGNGGLCPSQNLVDLYDMANGSSPFATYDATGAPEYSGLHTPQVNPASGYNDQNPYAGRDPRFYATVLHNGALWWNRAIQTFPGGEDNPTGNANATPTGYYNRKYLDDTKTHYLTGGDMYRNWILIRYAELLLNYAEALNEVEGPSPAVREALQQLRDRAGISGNLADRIDLTDREAMRCFIRKERAVELAFEDHRIWDVKRWNVAVEALNRPLYGITVTPAGNGWIYDRKVVQDRVFENKMYLYPIPEAEIWKTGMTNNPGW